MPQVNKSDRWFTAYWSIYIQREQSEAEKCCLDVDWLQKGQWYGPIILDRRMSKMYKISEKIIKLILEAMKNWKVELTAGEKTFAEEKIQTGIFYRDALSQLLFVKVVMRLNWILYIYHKNYHLMYMDDIKLFAKNEKELETLI